jgi:hypothetical protein
VGGAGVRPDMMPYNFFRSILRFGPVLSKQQQTGHGAPDGCDDGEETGKLSRGPEVVSGINTWYGQECHVGVEQHSAL